MVVVAMEINSTGRRLAQTWQLASMNVGEMCGSEWCDAGAGSGAGAVTAATAAASTKSTTSTSLFIVCFTLSKLSDCYSVARQ